MADEQRRCVKCNAPCRVSAKCCGACGSYLNNVTTQFCANCGKKECICAKQSRDATVTLLDKIAHEKETERVSLFGNKQKSKTLKLTTSTPLTKPKKLVTINVGIMTSDGRQSLKRVRGAWASIAIKPEADASRVLNNTIEKHAGMDQYFYEFEDYVLPYPDMKVCNLLPGSNESFAVEKYKHFLNKPYSKINLFVCLETHFLFLVEDQNNALEMNDNESREKDKLATTNDEILKADESYLKRIEENLTDIINNPITAEDHNEASTYLTENSTQCTSFEDDSYTLFTPPSRQNIFIIICPSCLKSFPANVIEAHADVCADEHKLIMSLCHQNILCHSSVIEIDSDDNGSIVLADSHSSETGTSISLPENPD